MRLPLHPSTPFLFSLTSNSTSNTAPPLIFIEQEPFLVELQGSLELPDAPGVEGDLKAMRGVRVGRVEFVGDQSRPVLRIAHHRLEGRLVTLSEPYAILRSTPSPSHPSAQPSATKRPRLSSEAESSRTKPPPAAEQEREEAAAAGGVEGEGEGTGTKIEIIGLVRRKIVFSKRPEPMVEDVGLSSEMEGLEA